MSNFIADNWIVILIVLGVILVGLVVALIVMDAKDKKLVAEYKAKTKQAELPKQEVEKEVMEEDVKEEQSVIADTQPVVKKTSSTKKASTSTSAKAKVATKILFSV